ncbi:MAG: GNAT family N-acetyltransferase [Chloroflexota bacterium]
MREATSADQWRIWRIVLGAGLDPTDLHWSHFLIAEHDGQIAGVGQIRPAARELGSLVVLPAYRGQGVGGLLIEALVARTDGDVYLECNATLAPYYARYGFIEIEPAQAPLALRRKAVLGARLAMWFGMRLAVMKRPAD